MIQIKKIHLLFFFAFFVALSLFEGVHVVLDLHFLLYFLYTIPLFLFLLDREVEYRIPRIFALFSGLFILFSFISLLFSREIGSSLDIVVRDISLFLLVIYVNAHSQGIKKYLPFVINTISTFYLISSLLLFLHPIGRSFIREVRLNLLYNPSYNHKAIGDFLTYGLLISFFTFFIEKKQSSKYFIFLFLPIFIISFSRSSYIALAVTCMIGYVIFRKEFKKASPLLVGSIGLNIVLFLILCAAFVTRIQGNIFIFLQDYLQKYFYIYTRPFTQSHFPFWEAGVKGFLLSPFVGVGAGTFQYISYRFTNTVFLWSYTSFNFIIDLLAEQGLLATLSFVALICYVIITAKKKNLYFLLYIALIISFLGFSSYVYIQIRLLFFIVMGILLQPSKNDYILPKKLCLILACIGILFVQVLWLHNFFIQQNMREIAQTIYPFDKDNLKVLIKKELKNRNDVRLLSLLHTYERYFNADPVDFEYLGDVYTSMGNQYNKKAIAMYEESFVWGSFNGGSVLSRVAKVYELKRVTEGEGKANIFILNILRTYYKMLEKNPNPDSNQSKTFEDIKNIYTK